jgi:outer membrane receptor for ferrienterochelin and colicin
LIVRNLFAPYPQDSVYNKYFNTFTSGLRNENIGKQNIYGIEGIVNAKISKNIILYTYYSYTYGVSISQQNVRTKIPRVSPHKVWAGLTFQNLFGFLTISPRYIWVSEMYNLNTLVFPNNIQPGFSNLDINISINNLAKHFTIFADFDNVLNSKIEHGGVYGQDVAYTATIPQQGFNFNVGMEVKF